MAAAMVVSEKMSPHEATPRFVVRMIEPFRYLLAMTWNSAAASSVGMGRKPSSSTMRTPGSGEEPHGGGPSALEGGFAAPGGEVGCGGVIHPVSGVDRSVTQRNGEHGFADAGRPDEQDVGGVVEETAGPELSDQWSRRPMVGLPKSKSLMVQGAGKFANRILASHLRCSVASTSMAEQRFEELGVSRLGVTGPFQPLRAMLRPPRSA